MTSPDTLYIDSGDIVECGPNGSHPGKSGRVIGITPTYVRVELPDGAHAFFERDKIKITHRRTDRSTIQIVEPHMFDLYHHLQRQRAWSERTFGPGDRAKGVVDHIRKELTEIEAAPGDLEEWIDVAILALDGAWRAGYSPEQIITQLQAKQAKNEARDWPDWRTAPADKAIEHVKS